MSNPNGDKGMNFERRVEREAREAGVEARRQPGSGVYKDYPNDLQIADFLAECKCGYERLTAGGERSFSFSMEWMNKVEANAKRLGLHGAVVIVRPGRSRRCLAVIDMTMLMELLKGYKIYEEDRNL